MKNRLSFPPAILFIFLSLILFLGYAYFSSQKKGDSDKEQIKELGQSASTPENCAKMEISGYELAQIDGKPAEISGDLAGQGKKELVRVYWQKSAPEILRSMPTLLKIF